MIVARDNDMSFPQLKTLRTMTNVEFRKHLRLYRVHMKGRGFEEQGAYELAGTEMRLIESRREDEVRPVKRAWRKEDTKNAMARERLWFDRLTRARATVDAFNNNVLQLY